MLTFLFTKGFTFEDEIICDLFVKREIYVSR